MSRKEIVAIYGMNNIGKTAVLKGVVEKLGNGAVCLKYPIYDTPTGRRINAYLRGGNPEGLDALAVQNIFAQNRVDFEPELIRMSEKGMVILEDYNGTGKVWGMLGAEATIEQMEVINAGQLEPDLNILLDGERFGTGIESNHKHEGIVQEGWDKGRMIHLDLAKRYGWKVVGVRFGELDREIEEVTNLIINGKRK